MALSKILTDTLLNSNSVKSLSQVSGADDNQVKQVLMDSLPTLVQNMQKNASTKSGEQALAKALSDHAKDDTSNISAFLKNVDLEDGAKILGHILGNKKNTVESGVAKKSGLTSSQASTILAAAAPLLLNVLGNQKEKEDKKESGSLINVLASALFDGNDNKGSNGVGEALADGLGSLLGGNSSSKNKGEAIGGIIGSLLGGAGKKTAAKKSSAKTAKKKTTKKTTGKKK